MTLILSGTNGITSVNGSAATPSVTGADTDTGIVYGTNTLSLATGGTTAVTVDSSQNVGIGTSTTSGSVLNIANSSSADELTFKGTPYTVITSESTGGMDIKVSQAVPMCFYTSNTERARIDSSGNLLVGTTSTVGTSAAGVIHAVSASTVFPPLALRNANASSGNYWKVGPDGGGNTLVVQNQSGQGVYIPSGNTSWTGTSDERLKDIIEPIENATVKVNSLRAVIGKFKTDEEGTRRSFLIAQDVQSVLPEAVSVRDDEIGTLGIAYTDVIPLLVAAIKEQQDVITQLQADVAALKAAA